MFKNYFKAIIRNLWKHKIFSLINILGIAIGMTAALLILHYVSFEYSYDAFHPNADRIYRVTTDNYKGDVITTRDAMSFNQTGTVLKQDLPEVMDFTMVLGFDFGEGFTFIKDGVKNKAQNAYFADSKFLDFFPYKVIAGDAQKALKEPYSVILTESLAKKYFQNENPIGQTFEITGGRYTHLYTVRSVMEDTPENTHLKFNMLISYETVWSLGDSLNWNGYNNYTYVLAKNNTDFESLKSKVFDLSAEKYLKDNTLRFNLQPVTDIHLHSNFTYETELNGDAQTVNFLIVVAILIVLIAWVNYVNLSTARAMDRAKEVGLRKVIGAQRKQLIYQFLLESCFVNGIALLLAIVFTELSIPVFNDFIGKVLPFNIWKSNYFLEVTILMFIVGVCLSGTYPAMVLSSFQPIQVLKGKFRNSKNGIFLRKTLVIFQFVASIILIAATITVYLQVDFMQKQDLGMNIEKVLTFKTPSYESNLDSIYVSKFRTFKQRVNNISNVQSIGLSSTIPASGPSNIASFSGGLNWDKTGKKEKGITYYSIHIDEDFLSTYEIDMLTGRNFNRKDTSARMLINKAAMKLLGLPNAKEAVGENLIFGDNNENKAQIIGVMKDYNRLSLKYAVEPTVYFYRPSDNFGHFSVKLIADKDLTNTISQIETIWSQMFPESIFEYNFMDEQFDAQYRSDRQFGQISNVFSILAVFIACFGLFGLSSFTMMKRSKEIGIRKVLGASLSSLLTLLSKEVIQLTLISTFIALPISYYILSSWLQNYSYRVSLQWWLFIIPTILVLVISLLTISYQIIKAAQTNPVNVLKNE